jgi:hypothetical protein
MMILLEKKGENPFARLSRANGFSPFFSSKIIILQLQNRVK